MLPPTYPCKPQNLPNHLPAHLRCLSPYRRSVQSIACESYLIVRPEGNVMVDTPRFNPVLAKRLQEMGGVKYIFLTHKVGAVPGGMTHGMNRGGESAPKYS